jgi:hypothetical protein
VPGASEALARAPETTHATNGHNTRTERGGSVKTPSRSTPSLGANPAGCARTETPVV